ncbi:conserved hypothetical protein [delta proteobacterium NaphS2]|nr:conserved hypothetical protein [delta proteobacterium NaphS2]
MKRSGKQWWHFRNEELVELAEAHTPFYVYNEETLNEIFFDLSAMDALSGLFYPYHLNFHQAVLQKAFDLDAYFRCNSLLEADHLRDHFPKLPPSRIFFLSDHKHKRECEDAAHQGLHVAVRADKNTMNACLEAFQDKSIFLCLDMGDEIPQSGIPKKTTHGIYVCPDSRFLSLCSQDEKISLFKTLAHQFSGLSTLVLGNAANNESISPMDGMELSEIETYLEAIQEACPQFELRLELPMHLVSYAGALLVKALASGTAEGMPYIQTDLPMNDALYHEIHGTPHQIVNLSRPEEERIILTRMIQQYKHAENGIVYLNTPCFVEQGDIILLTHMGAYRRETLVNHKGRNGLSEWYLKARCLCPVRI